jgi:hypothetical protein
MGLRQDILTAALAALATISPDNGFETEISGRAYEWRKTPVLPAECPCVELRDSGYSSRKMNNLMWLHTLPITVTSYSAGETAETVLRGLLKDVIDVITGSTSLRVLLSMDIAAGPGSQIEVEHEGNRLAAGESPFELKYITDSPNPFT